MESNNANCKISNTNGSMVNWQGIDFPYKSVLSLKPLLEYCQKDAFSDKTIQNVYVQKIKTAMERSPELFQPLEDISLLDKHEEFLSFLMTVIFPKAFQSNTCAAAIVPFQFRPFYMTDLFQNLKLFGDCKSVSANVDTVSMLFGKTIYACSAILRQFYNIEIEFDYPIIFNVSDPETGLQRYLKMNFDPSFVEIQPIGKLKSLSKNDEERLRSNLTNLDIWTELLPPDRFEFHGFAVLNAIDVTEQEVLSSLKNNLLERDALLSPTKFKNLRNKLRAILQRPDLLLGLAGIPGSANLLHDFGLRIGDSFILSDRCRYKCASYDGSIYEKVIKHGDKVLIEDLTMYSTQTDIEKEIVEQGIRNILIAPLHSDGKMVGLLEIGSPNPGDINDLNALKLDEVFSLFSIAISRSLNEMNDRIEAVIKEQCTAIHPSVEWRFRSAAMTYLHKQRNKIPAEMEQIVFDDVYPLYGLSDIRGSSNFRNDSIRADLIDQLNLAQEILTLAYHRHELPFLDELRYQLGKHLDRIKAGLDSGDEINILDFLHRKIEPNFDLLADFGDEVSQKISAYKMALDPELGVIYRKRKDFEESVMRLNESISNHIDAEQNEAQSMYPHYFEKYKSDGVEHGIYIGKSLVENGKFDLLYLKNIRLWQLMLICGVARKSEQVKPKLKIPLEMAHLILVQNSPLAVRFRYDEKQFDVDGAYNVRYEIMKKRIDKAVIKGTDERLTQPGKIAIVYSQPKEALEYEEYIEYLQSTGDLKNDIEKYDLEDLQGMTGLKALRVTVNLQMPQARQSISELETSKVVKI